tara:strand:+ start:248 stop:697 length:450 start_codon:yes stop_codon:yes gene_type:complete
MRHHCKGDIKNRKSHGWDMNLYRNTDRRMIAGVCAGLADHFEVDTWVVRLAAIGGLLFLGGATFIAYIGLWFFLEPKRAGEQKVEYEYDEVHHRYRPKRMFKYTDSATSRLQRAKTTLDGVNDRVAQLERHVTSGRFDLEREFSKLRDE